jgi:hypothetical protein
MKSSWIVAAAALSATGCDIPANNVTASNLQGATEHAAPPPRMDVERLLNADKATVATILGQPRECRREADTDPRYRGESCAYGGGTAEGEATELFFVEGRVANLTLPNFGLLFDEASLERYGIEVASPTFSNTGVRRWTTQIASMPVEVNMFEGEPGRISYVYIRSMAR